MTRMESDSYPKCPCPCGKGHIVLHVRSTDYRHDKPTFSHSIDCPACAGAWRVDHGTLVLRASEGPLKEIQPRHDQVRTTLFNLARELVRQHLEARTFKSKKAELEYLTARDLTTSRYKAYLKDRASGSSMHELALGLRNAPWLEEVAASAGRSKELAGLMSQLQNSSAELEHAAKLVIRNAIGSHRDA